MVDATICLNDVHKGGHSLQLVRGLLEARTYGGVEYWQALNLNLWKIPLAQWTVDAFITIWVTLIQTEKS